MYQTGIQWRNIPSGVYWMCTNRDHRYKLYLNYLFLFWIFWLLKWISWSKLESEHLPLATGFGWEMGLIIALHMIHSIDPINVSALLYICKIWQAKFKLENRQGYIFISQLYSIYRHILSFMYLDNCLVPVHLKHFPLIEDDLF